MIVEICPSNKRQFFNPIIISNFHKYNISYQVLISTFTKDFKLFLMLLTVFGETENVVQRNRSEMTQTNLQYKVKE
jgi:hypothetical protein